MYQGSLKKTKLTGRSNDGHLGITRDGALQNFDCNNGGDVEARVPSSEKDFTSLKTPTEVPPSSFEFYVWSDEGINLHVDLNLPPSDWTNRFKNEVCISENVYGNKSQSLWQDLGCFGESSTTRKSSFLCDTNSGQINDHNERTKFSPSLKLTKDDVAGLDQQVKGGCSDTLTPLNLTVNMADNLKDQSTVSAELAINVADNSKEDQLTVSAELSYGALNNIISGAESHSKVACKGTLDSGAIDASLIKSVCGSFGNSLSEPGAFEHQNSKSTDENFEDFTLLNGSCFVDSGVVCPGASVSGSMELQISEVASYHKYASLSICENDGSLDLINPKNSSDAEQDGLVNINDLTSETDGSSFRSLTEEWELGKIANGRESSECSQFDGPLKMSGLDIDDRESEMELHRKRKHRGSKVEGSILRPVTRSSRSMKHAVGMVLPRRSMRLISKLPSFFWKNYTQQ